MINRISPMRRHSRFPVRWSVLYGGDDFVAHGTVLDVTHIGWRVAGSMPVLPAMQLTLQLQVPDKAEPVRVKRATVLWVNRCEFAIEVHEMAPADRAWLADFLEDKLGLAWQSHAGGPPSRSRANRADTLDGVPYHREGHADVRDPLPAALADRMESMGNEARRRIEERGTGEKETETPSHRFKPEVWQSAQRILTGMVVLNARRARTGRDIIAEN